jgi:hypothetical protein
LWSDGSHPSRHDPATDTFGGGQPEAWLASVLTEYSNIYTLEARALDFCLSGLVAAAHSTALPLNDTGLLQ